MFGTWLLLEQNVLTTTSSDTIGLAIYKMKQKDLLYRSADSGLCKFSNVGNLELVLCNRNQEILYGLGKPVCPAPLGEHVGCIFLCMLIK